MYGAATYRMADAIRLDTIDWIPQLALTVALAAWTTTTIGLLHHTTRRPTPIPPT